MQALIESCTHLHAVFLAFTIVSIELLVNNAMAKRIEKGWRKITFCVPGGIRNIVRQVCVVCFFICQGASICVDLFSIKIKGFDDEAIPDLMNGRGKFNVKEYVATNDRFDELIVAVFDHAKFLPFNEEERVYD